MGSDPAERAFEEHRVWPVPGTPEGLPTTSNHQSNRNCEFGGPQDSGDSQLSALVHRTVSSRPPHVVMREKYTPKPGSNSSVEASGLEPPAS